MTDGMVYLDEAGNTGLNFLDPSQPTFVLAGWIVPTETCESASAVVTAISLESGSRDLKGGRMMRSPTGRDRVGRLVRELQEIGCLPVYMLYEKRYAVAAKVVETFLDSEYNDHLSRSFETDVFAKQALAQQLYDLPEGSLTPVWDAICAVDAERMSESLGTLVERCRLLRADDLAHLLAGARRHVERNAAAAKYAQADPRWRLGEALPATSLITLAGEIDAIASDLGLTLVEIIHDETSSFQPNIESTFHAVAGAEPVESPLEEVFPHGGRFRIGYSVVRSLRFAASEDELLVQAADILAALMATIPSKILNTISGENSTLVGEYAHLVLLSEIGHPIPCHIVASSQFRKDVSGVVSIGRSKHKRQTE